ncbi:hypothetical protein HDC37_003208 [Microbacterium sp. AK009]|uniref:hypothetical protein n=1 Tax=Microbacterium sp. AK009 TaxID=2723068 RepID=UPI0015CC04CB|nr:hypothetical protein [Microbacterium sp. AK009]NYF18348.1 hypothetical protein [Microbacterium sp. AK009]
MSTARAVRVVRGSVAAGVATFVALVSHVTGGGHMPGWLGIVVPLILSLAVCTVLAGRRVSLWRLSLAVAVSQVLFHTLFVLGAVPSSASSPVVSSHHAHGVASLAMTDAAGSSTNLHADASMWLMHGLAAVVTIAALYRGERALDRLWEIVAEFARWAWRRLFPVLNLPVRPLSGRVAAVGTWVPPVASAIVFAVSRRGPPAVAVF